MSYELHAVQDWLFQEARPGSFLKYTQGFQHARLAIIQKCLD